MNSNAPFTFLVDIAAKATPPEDGILSTSPYQDDKVKVVVFGFGVDQELSEHTASTPAILHVLSGEVTLGLGADTVEAKAGAWVHMPANLTHSVHAKTPAVLLLLLLKS